MKTALLLTSAPIPVVRIGMIGLGHRGLRAAKRLVNIAGTDIRAIADLSPATAREAQKQLLTFGVTVDKYSGENGWKDICDRDDIDLVYICTSWSTHEDFACYAMEHGKHVAVEVPASTTVEGCRKLVEVSETTQKHCVMLENCCYDPFALTTIYLMRKGKLGTITHAEGAYIHYTVNSIARKTNHTPLPDWQKDAYALHDGNPYPTHGIGPVCLTMDIHRGDRMQSIISLTSEIRGLNGSRVNTSIIKTFQGRTILLHHDVSTPRPYNRKMITCGTKGFTQKYSRKCIMFANETPERAYARTEARLAKYEHPVTKIWGRDARKLTNDNEMNYVMDMRLIYCLRNGLPMDIDVYDAAEWSAISELSAMSARAGGMPVAFPDFTNGQWKTAKRHEFFI